MNLKFIWTLLTAAFLRLNLNDDTPGGGAAPAAEPTGGELPSYNEVGEESELGDGDTTPTQEKPTKPATQQPGAASSIDEAKLIEIAVKAAQAGAANGQQPPTPSGAGNKQISQEELRKLINYYEVSAQDLAEMFGLDSPEDITPNRVKAFNRVLQAATKQAFSMSTLYFQEKIQPLQSGFESFQQQQVAQQEAMYAQQIITEFPDLGKPELRDLVVIVKDQILKEGKKFDSPSSFGKELHARVNAVLTKATGRPLGGGNKPSSQPAKKMVTGTTGGTSAPSGGAARPADNPQVRAIWG